MGQQLSSFCLLNSTSEYGSRLPLGHCLHNSVENCYRLPHTGGECHLVGLASIHQALVESSDDRVTLGCHQRCHVQDSSQTGSPTPHRSSSVHGATVAVKGSHYDRCGDLTVV